MILTADWHLTDAPDDEYRWAVFDRLLDYCKLREDWDVHILGDLCDRKDRHSGLLVNRLLQGLRRLIKAGCDINIIMGNHDEPMSGPPYWRILNNVDGVRFWTKPEQLTDNLILLPYTPDVGSWTDYLDVDYTGLLFLHQPVSGALLEHGTAISWGGNHDLNLPAGCIAFAGDIHTPQTLNNLTYVGAPHPVKFGDSYQTRMLHINRKGKILHKHVFRATQRFMLDLNRDSELEEIDAKPGDQAKVRFNLEPDEIQMWPIYRKATENWAKECGVNLMSIQSAVAFEAVHSANDVPIGLDSDPLVVFDEYCKEEGLPDVTQLWGRKMLETELQDGQQ